MPAKKKAKGKRAKGGKEKKEKKQKKEEEEVKASVGTDVETPDLDSFIWELRLKTTSQNLAKSQKVHFDLVRANDYLNNKLGCLERDTTGLGNHCEREFAKRERQIVALEEKLKIQAELALEEKNKLISEKSLVQSEVTNVKMKEADKEEELTDITIIKKEADKDRSEKLGKIRRKFSEEKKRLANELTDQYNHQLALLREEDNAVFTTLKEALDMEFELQTKNVSNAETRNQDLEKTAGLVIKDNVKLRRQKDILQSIVKNKAAEIRVKRWKMSQLVAKVDHMEELLEHEAVKVEQMDKKEKMNLVAIQHNQLEMEKIQQVLIEQEKEMQHVKQLASTVVRKHREMEKFFHDALHHVRQEITANRMRFKKEALHEYCRRIRKATDRKIRFPPIQNFHDVPHSTNSVYIDMEAATRWYFGPDREVQLSDLTWEQKEQVLERLFAAMKGETARKLHQYVVMCTCSKRWMFPTLGEALNPRTVDPQSSESTFCSTPNISLESHDIH